MREGLRSSPGEVGGVTITEFILARVAEDEKEARAMDEDLRKYPPSTYEMAQVPMLDMGVPERALAECEAKRKIVEWHTNFEGYDEAECCEERWGPLQLQAPQDRELSAGMTSAGDLTMRESFATQEYLGCVTLMMLAAIWSDHPEYDARWRP